MLQECFEPDALFLIFEEDWGITNDNVEPPPEQPGGNAPGFMVAGLRPVGRNYYVPTAGAYPSKQEHGTVVGDLVSIITKATRANHGDLVWMTWQPGQGEVPKGSTKIKSGAMLIALSVRGAKTLAEAMDKKIIKREHFDVALLRFLKDESKDFGCYVYPPLGNYSQHVSGCEETYSVTARPSCWTTRWVCPGTRRKDDPSKRDKWLVVPTKKGDSKWLTKFDLDKEYDSLDWRTLWSVPFVGRPDRRKDFVPPADPASAIDGHLAKVLRDVRASGMDSTLVLILWPSGEALHIPPFSLVTPFLQNPTHTI